MIAYKVVMVKTRYSCVARDGFRNQYLKGKTVTAIPGTLGIFCFSSKRAAEDWSCLNNDWMVIKVDGNKSHRPKTIITWWRMVGKFSRKEYMYNLKHHDCWDPPEKTVCFDSVKVLE